MKKFTLLFALAVLMMLAAVPVRAHIFYEVKADKATVWLLGSIHMADSSFYPMSPVVNDAFEQSNYLVTEVLMDELMSTGREFLDSLYYPKGDSLPLHIADTTWQRVIGCFKEYGVGRGMLKKLKPSILVLTLSQLEYVKHGYSANLGMEMYFTKNAGSDKSLLQLESLDSQADLLAQMGDGEEPNKFINDAIDERGETIAMIDSIATAWKSGDADRLYELVNKGMETDSENEEEFNKKLLDDRNNGMSGKIIEFLQSDGKYFVIVGAAHLLGKDGLVTQLQSAGYEVVQK